MTFQLTDDQIAAYDGDGLLFLRDLFDQEEIELLRTAMETDPAVQDHSLLRAAQAGGGAILPREAARGDAGPLRVRRRAG